MLELNQYYLITAIPSWLAALYFLWRLHRLQKSTKKMVLATVEVSNAVKD